MAVMYFSIKRLTEIISGVVGGGSVFRSRPPIQQSVNIPNHPDWRLLCIMGAMSMFKRQSALKLNGFCQVDDQTIFMVLVVILRLR